MEKLKIQEVEPRFAEELEIPFKAALKKLGYSIPESFRLHVSLLRTDGRKKRSTAGAYTWVPESEPMQFSLEPLRREEAVPSAELSHRAQVPPIRGATNEDASPGTAGQKIYIHPAEAELLKALDHAESTPGWSFVSLKKFRDEILPSADVPSIRSDVERQSVLRSAIDKRLILKKPVPNPKSPQFPVTSIRLNRLMPEVQELLGLSKKDLDFHPIHIKGEPLSATILRERR